MGFAQGLAFIGTALFGGIFIQLVFYMITGQTNAHAPTAALMSLGLVFFFAIVINVLSSIEKHMSYVEEKLSDQEYFRKMGK